MDGMRSYARKFSEIFTVQFLHTVARDGFLEYVRKDLGLKKSSAWFFGFLIFLRCNTAYNAFLPVNVENEQGA
jgi:hypothetical protein